LGLPILFLLVVFANNITNGNLLLRYKGETYGTLLGTKENDLNNLTTGRLEIFLSDVSIFSEHPIFGVGVAASAAYRTSEKGAGAIAHVELSRLLSEHGILGGLVFLLLLTGLFNLYLKRKTGNILLFLFGIIAMYTTFHAATRTFLSPLLLSIAFIPLRNIKK
jgi:O-antigen ligase